MITIDMFDGDVEKFLAAIEEERTKEFKFLDSLDILPLLEKNLTITDIATRLHKYNDEYDGEDMYAEIDESELMFYIEKRFHVNFEFRCVGNYHLDTDVQKGTRYDKNPVPDVSEME